jgi:DNA-binding GntR family transcriptional regulator
VRVPTEQDIRGHYIVREALETQSARLFAEKASAWEREELTAFASRLDVLYEVPGQPESARVGNDSWYDVLHQHSRFHLRIAEYAGCQQLVDAMKRNQVVVFNWIYDLSVETRARPQGWHSRLMNELNSGSVEKADAAMRQHVRHGMERILEHIGRLPPLEESTLAVHSSGKPY